ncbi:hypothetical protein C0J52_27472 [Blattella germanica]|nr:hypothetical protein C0J52_27472 [Blattella germanica]
MFLGQLTGINAGYGGSKNPHSGFTKCCARQEIKQQYALKRVAQGRIIQSRKAEYKTQAIVYVPPFTYKTTVDEHCEGFKYQTKCLLHQSYAYVHLCDDPGVLVDVMDVCLAGFLIDIGAAVVVNLLHVHQQYLVSDDENLRWGGGSTEKYNLRAK